MVTKNDIYFGIAVGLQRTMIMVSRRLINFMHYHNQNNKIKTKYFSILSRKHNINFQLMHVTSQTYKLISLSLNKKINIENPLIDGDVILLEVKKKTSLRQVSCLCVIVRIFSIVSQRPILNRHIDHPTWRPEHNVNISNLLGSLGDCLSPLNKQTNVYIKARKHFQKNSDSSNV